MPQNDFRGKEHGDFDWHNRDFVYIGIGVFGVAGTICSKAKGTYIRIRIKSSKKLWLYAGRES